MDAVQLVRLIEDIETAKSDDSKGEAPRRKGVLRSVSAKTLHAHSLRLVDRKLERATLFPFFDAEGTTHWVLLALEHPARVILLEWREGLFRKPLFGAMRLDLAWSVLDDATSELAEKVSYYWHWDPWWLLKLPTLKAHPASSPLYITNAVEPLGPVTGLYYSPDLGRVTWRAIEGDEGTTLKRWRPGLLPPSPRTARPPGPSGPREWRLRPFWER